MSAKSISTVGKVAIALAIIGGVLAISRALYNYSQSGEWDFGKLALGIAIPCLVYVVVKSSASAKS